MRNLAQSYTKTAKNVAIKINFVIDKGKYIMYNNDGLNCIGRNNFWEKTLQKGETMKGIKIVKRILLAGLAAMFLFSGCVGMGTSSSSSSVAEPHAHEFTKLSAREATCLKDGRLAYWYCEDCGKYYLDAKATREVKLEETVIAKLPHNPVKIDGTQPSCIKSGKMDSWICLDCNRIFSDEACTVRVEESELTLPTIAHNLQHVEAVPVNGMENGVKEHWICEDCEGFFKDENGRKKITVEDTIAYSLMNIPDFIVEIPEGRDPVVLQLTDTQIIDAAQIRPGRDGVDKAFWATDKIQARCYDFITETINATNPDFIILTGDNIYGEFDDNGTVWTSFINFMDSFEIPWSPIFGNHDIESKMGVDWQCEQLAKMEYCLFEQKELTGNSNYSVGIAQGGKLTRVFYMMDTNGAGNASAESLANGHTVTSVGFKQDQIDWYTKQIEILKEVSPDTKISFAYHIQQHSFAEAYAKYGFEVGEKAQDINIDRLEEKAEGDFGYIGRDLKGEWDASNQVFNSFKRLGVDSIFVGHEHCNSASVVYEGIRFQFGQKSSEYDRFNCLEETGTVRAVSGKPGAGLTSMIGGSVIVLSEEDGSIIDAYIYYCGFENGTIDWSQFN